MAENVCYQLREISNPQQTFAYHAVGWTINNAQQEFIQPKNAKKIVELAFIDCNISCFPARLSEFFPHLKIIRARECGITGITKEHFKGLPGLIRLDLSENNIKLLTDDVFDNTPMLKIIGLRHNELAFIGNKTFASLKSLQFADLKRNPCIDVIYNGNHSFINREGLQRTIECCSQLSPSTANKLQNNDVNIPKDLLAMEGLKDFKITVNGEKFTAHRIFLAAHSKVFKEIFEGNPEAREAEIGDITSGAMKTIIEYIYQGKLPEGNFDAEAIHSASKKLGIVRLEVLTAKQAALQDFVKKFNKLET